VTSGELSKYKLYLVGVQEVEWDGSSTELAREYIFLYGKENENHELGIGCVRFEVFTTVTMKNAVFWDINTQFVPRRKHIMSPLKSPAC
jgi:hypothetical protein